MIALIDSIFIPILNWLDGIKNSLLNAAVPDYYTVPVHKYLGYFTLLGPHWLFLIVFSIVLSGIYGYLYFTSSGIGILERLRNILKWW